MASSDIGGSAAPRLARPGNHFVAYRHVSGAAPGVMFLPGFNSDMQGLKALALEAFCRARGRQFTRFDYFGHGESSGDFAAGTIGRWRDDALAVLDELTRGAQVLVGSSMGGWIMLLLALARPERVHALVGIAAAPDMTESRRTSLSAARHADLATRGFCELPNAYDDGRPYLLSRRLLEEGRAHCVLGSAEIPLDRPLRLIHAVDDPDVPWQRSLEILRRWRGDDAQLLLQRLGGHRLSAPADLQRLQAVVGALPGLR